MDDDRQWFKSNNGLEASQTHRNDSFCAYTILPESCDVFVVPDAPKDDRFKRNKLVTGSPRIRFYAGASLMVAGVKVGSLCIIDTKPRHDFNVDQRMNLLDLGEAVANLIRERREYNLRAKKDRSDLMTEIMHSIRTPLMSLIIASSILDRSKCHRPMEDSDIYDNCIQDVVTAVKEIQVQVENTLNMSGTFVTHDLALRDAINVFPTPPCAEEETKNHSSSAKVSTSNLSNSRGKCLDRSKETLQALPPFLIKQESLEWEEKFILPSSARSSNEL